MAASPLADTGMVAPPPAANGPTPDGLGANDAVGRAKLSRKLAAAEAHIVRCAAAGDVPRRRKIEAAAAVLRARLAGPTDIPSHSPRPPKRRKLGPQSRPAATAPAATQQPAYEPTSLADRAAAAAAAAFGRLAARGKPQGGEWTVLAAVLVQDGPEVRCRQAPAASFRAHGAASARALVPAVLLTRSRPADQASAALRCITLATGTKCVGREALATAQPGARVHDSHAEVLARRALQRFLALEAGLLLAEVRPARHLARCTRACAQLAELGGCIVPCGAAAGCGRRRGPATPRSG